jgi:hypothetical protein
VSRKQKRDRLKQAEAVKRSMDKKRQIKKQRKDREQQANDARSFYIAKGLISPSLTPKRKITVNCTSGAKVTKTI